MKKRYFFVFFLVALIGLFICNSFVFAAVTWVQTDWSGGPGQADWSDNTSFFSSSQVDYAIPGSLGLSNQVWAQTYGGSSGRGVANSVEQTSDGGYIVAGLTSSFGDGSDDVWVMRFSSSGSLDWEKTYGDRGEEQSNAIQQTSDGGYIVAGYTDSFGAGGKDFWILKLDSYGVVTWEKTYGGIGDDEAKSIKQISGGGYIVAGDTTSFGTGLSDPWVLELDSAGLIIWEKTYGGIRNDYTYSVLQTSDGGYAVAGYTYYPPTGAYEGGWIIKLDSRGTVSWQKAYNSKTTNSNLVLHSFQQTSDGGYIATGFHEYYALDTGVTFLMKLGIDGSIDWFKGYTYDYGDEWGNSIQQTSDGGYVVVGQDYSNMFIFKLDSEGLADSACGIINDGTIPSSDYAGVSVDSKSTVSDTRGTVNTSLAVVTITSALSDIKCSITNGVLTSSTLSENTNYTWGPLKYTGTIPTNTNISFEVSTDEGLSWTPVINYLTQTFGTSKNVAYRATLSNTDSISIPILEEVSIERNSSVHSSGGAVSGGRDCKPGEIVNPVTGAACTDQTSSTSPQEEVTNSVVVSTPEIVICKLTARLALGKKEDEVKCLQNKLNIKIPTNLVVDGIFGKLTKAAVIKFQLANKLVGDGIVGPITRGVLNK